MDAAARRVSEVMEVEVATLRAQDRLDLADDVMRLGRVRHMPVLDGTRIVGIVSSEISIALGLRGISHVLSTGCTSSTDAIGYAAALIRQGSPQPVCAPALVRSIPR